MAAFPVMEELMLTQWLEMARRGEPVWLSDVREGSRALPGSVSVIMQITLCAGGKRDFELSIPRWADGEQRQFVLDYVTACVFNALSALGGRETAFYLDLRETEAAALLGELDGVFQVHESRRGGCGKVINIADRLCRAFSGGRFAFAVRDSEKFVPALKKAERKNDLLPRLRSAVGRTARGVCCGIDIGGTDIKAAVARDGKLLCVKEYDWNPAASPTAEGIIGPIELLVRLMACCAAGPVTPELARALEKDASDEEMARAVEGRETAPLDVLGVSFPDIVIRDRIVGGETPKMKGMRDNPDVDFEEGFAKLRELKQILLPYCREGAAVHMTNDGHIAAYTAAAELAFSGAEPDFSGGVIAHALGTDFGVGYLNSDGTIPEMPVELYDFLLDLGSWPQRRLPPEDLRSTRNENSGMPGARRYLGQAAAFRLAYGEDPALLSGFTEEGVLSIRQQPEDLRKPCLAYLMEQAQAGNERARAVFEQIGRNLGQISREMLWLMAPETPVRYLFGRFVKHPACFALLRSGCAQVLPEIQLEAADEDLACTPLMRGLADHGVTVAQFGQAVGAMYYAAMPEE